MTRIRGVLVAAACLSGVARANQPSIPGDEQRLSEGLGAVDLTPCQRAAAAAGSFGSAVVTAWLPARRDHTVPHDLVVTRSLGPGVAACAQRRLVEAMAVLTGLRTNGPRWVVTEDFTLGTPRALRPAFGALAGPWEELLAAPAADRAALRAGLAQRLPAGARLTASECLWLPGTDAMYEQLERWQREAGPFIDAFWRSTVAAALPEHAPSSQVAWVSDRRWLVVSFAPLRGRGEPRALWTPDAGTGHTACLDAGRARWPRPAPAPSARRQWPAGAVLLLGVGAHEPRDLPGRVRRLSRLRTGRQ